MLAVLIKIKFFLMKLQSPCLNIWKKNFPEYFSRTNYDDSIRNFIKQINSFKDIFQGFCGSFQNTGFPEQLRTCLRNVRFIQIDWALNLLQIPENLPNYPSFFQPIDEWYLPFCGKKTRSSCLSRLRESFLTCFQIVVSSTKLNKKCCFSQRIQNKNWYLGS